MCFISFSLSATILYFSDVKPFREVGQILFIIFVSTSSWVAKSVASLGKGEGRIVKNYFLLVLTFIIL